jgi:LacI family transcriptional regulator
MVMNSERATIEDVAKRAGVSIATVSRVVNRIGTVSEKTKARVESAIVELNYYPNSAARGLAARKTYTIGLIAHEIDGEFFQPMLRGIERVANDHGYDVLFHSTRPDARKRTSIGEHNADGVIVFANGMTEDQLLNFHLQNFPVVLLHRTAPPGLSLPCVTVENQTGARMMVDHLIENCGHRHIAYLAGPKDHEDSYWREIGYRESLAAHGIDEVLVGEGRFEIQASKETVTRWIRERVVMDAIFAGDDESALGAILAVNEAGLRVPDDIAVVGFDDIRLARYLTPPLTTVRAPIEDAAAEAVNQLVRLITTGEAEPLTMLPTELVVRQSCGVRKDHR